MKQSAGLVAKKMEDLGRRLGQWRSTHKRRGDRSLRLCGLKPRTWHESTSYIRQHARSDWVTFRQESFCAA
jgi:hypothetical protein